MTALELSLEYVRSYGEPPYTVAVLHGGPGAPGYMAPVARELASRYGVIEPLQTKETVPAQISELGRQLEIYANNPIVLVGSSWGAVLALFGAARFPEKVKKIILVGSAVFDADSSASIGPRRLERLSDFDRARYNDLVNRLESSSEADKDALLKEMGDLFDKTDMYDPLTTSMEIIDVQYDIHMSVWADFVTLRDAPGYLQTEFSRITCPAVIIHGDYDPHPIDGIYPFLESCLPSVSLHLLSQCGHYPWIERHARDRFYALLNDEVQP